MHACSSISKIILFSMGNKKNKANTNLSRKWHKKRYPPETSKLKEKIPTLPAILDACRIINSWQPSFTIIMNVHSQSCQPERISLIGEKFHNGTALPTYMYTIDFTGSWKCYLAIATATSNTDVGDDGKATLLQCGARW